MCLEGGCGACVVNVRTLNSTTQEYVSFSVNSVSIIEAEIVDKALCRKDLLHKTS